MDSGEILRTRAEHLNASKRCIQEAEAILEHMTYINSSADWSLYIFKFYPALWRARRHIKKAERLSNKYDRALKGK